MAQWSGKNIPVRGKGHVVPRSVVVTGASTGIGAACASHLVQLEFDVFAGVRTAADGDALRLKAGDRLVPVLLDVTSDEAIRVARDQVAERVAGRGPIGLVNNAGFALAGPLELLDREEVRHQLEVNTIGPLAVVQAFLPLLRAAGGRIVNMSSISGRATMPFLGAYSASKSALEAMSDALRVELGPWGIAVSLIEPGAVVSEIWHRSRDAAERKLNRIPPDHVALYRPALERLRDVTAQAERRAIPSSEVAKVVASALTCKRPKSRYLIGHDARLRALMKFWLPDRLQDAVLGWFMEWPRRSPPGAADGGRLP
jgi:NAD(P)-dependent dehydrogenase (short-subunit alcohol dehydrogenase family)